MALKIISDQINEAELNIVLEYLTKASVQDGDIVEFGCYIGSTSIHISKYLQQINSTKEFHVYDSFEGLPPKSPQDQTPIGDDFVAGELNVSKKAFIEVYRKHHLNLPIIHKGWFEQLTVSDVPSEVCFAFLDGDFYSSILASLKLVWPKMTKNGIVLVHDYNRNTLPGVKRAIIDYFGREPKTYQHNIAIFIKS